MEKDNLLFSLVKLFDGFKEGFLRNALLLHIK